MRTVASRLHGSTSQVGVCIHIHQQASAAAFSVDHLPPQLLFSFCHLEDVTSAAMNHLWRIRQEMVSHFLVCLGWVDQRVVVGPIPSAATDRIKIRGIWKVLDRGTGGGKSQR